MSSEKPRGRFRLPAPPLWLMGFFEGLQVLLLMALLVALPVGGGLVAQQWGEVDASSVVSTVAQVWLVIHAVPLELPEAHALFRLVPLGLTLIPLLLAWRAGQRLARGAYPNQLWQGLLPFALVYVAGAVGIATVADDALAQVNPWWVVLTVTAVIVLGSVGGCMAEARSISRLFGVDLEARVYQFSQRLKWTGAYLWAVLRGAVVASVSAVALSAAVLATVLAWRWMDVVNAHQQIGAGLVGTFALVLLHLAVAPNLVLWTLSYTTGVGFWVGSDSHISPFTAGTGALPDVPVLAALPDQVYEYGWAVLAVPAVAGILAGWWLVREGENHMDDWFALHIRPRFISATLSTLVLGLLTGLVTALLSLLPLWLSHISLGLGRLVDVGPHALFSAGMLGAWVAAGTVVGYALVSAMKAMLRPMRRRHEEKKQAKAEKRRTKHDDAADSFSAAL